MMQAHTVRLIIAVEQVNGLMKTLGYIGIGSVG